jgi:small subunit ribosomal protein S7
MSRRYTPAKREIKPDQRYGSVEIAMFVNRLMVGGKKSTAYSVMYGALDIVAERAKRDPVEAFSQALKNVTPALEVKPRRVGGSTYQVPVEVLPHRRATLAMRWLLEAARSRSGKSMAEKLASEILDALQNQGAAAKRKEDTHRMAEANRAFAHYRW